MLITNTSGENPTEMRTGREPTSRTGSLRAAKSATSSGSCSSANQVSSPAPVRSRFRTLFDAALAEGDDVLLLPLCDIFAEIGVMMSSWAYVFHVAVVDLQRKVDRIRAAVAARPDKYRTMRAAVGFERAIVLRKENGGIAPLLVSLHRTLRFTVAFLAGIRRADEHAEMSTLARDAYSATVARHHNWATRKMTVTVMGSVPPRRDMMSSILKQDGNGVDEAEFLDGFLARAEVLRDRCDAILGKE